MEVGHITNENSYGNIRLHKLYDIISVKVDWTDKRVLEDTN